MNIRHVKVQYRILTAQSQGQAVVEAAMTMLLLFVFIFAIFEAGRLIQVQQALTDAAREGARRSVAPLTKTMPGTLATPADVEGVVRSYLDAASVSSAAATVLVDQAVVFAGSPTQYTRVTVTYPYRIMTLLMFGNLNMTLTGQSLMRNETSQ